MFVKKEDASQCIPENIKIYLYTHQNDEENIHSNRNYGMLMSHLFGK